MPTQQLRVVPRLVDEEHRQSKGCHTPDRVGLKVYTYRPLPGFEFHSPNSFLKPPKSETDF